MNVTQGKKTDTDAKVRRVVGCNGQSWHTNAQSASDYLFDPAFMKFFLLCIILYATLIGAQAETAVPLIARLVFWIGLVMTSLIWLLLSVSLSVAAHDRGITKAIYTPLILFPLILINVFVEQLVLPVLNVDLVASHVIGLEYAVRNAVIIITLEIMHARYVVPQHPTYVAPQKSSAQPNVPPQTNTAPAIADAKEPMLPSSGMSPAQALVADQHQVAQVDEPAPQPKSVETESDHKIVIARQKLDVADILWIKSEDHYLIVQMKDRNLMLRGKLRTVVDQLGDQIGVQINRSIWVAYVAIRSVDDQKNGTAELQLEDGVVYGVSKARLLMFKHNYERFKAFSAEGAS